MYKTRRLRRHSFFLNRNQINHLQIERIIVDKKKHRRNQARNFHLELYVRKANRL